jgi:hypothetical protein
MIPPPERFDLPRWIIPFHVTLSVLNFLVAWTLDLIGHFRNTMFFQGCFLFFFGCSLSLFTGTWAYHVRRIISFIDRTPGSLPADKVDRMRRVVVGVVLVVTLAVSFEFYHGSQRILQREPYDPGYFFPLWDPLQIATYAAICVVAWYIWLPPAPDFGGAATDESMLSAGESSDSTVSPPRPFLATTAHSVVATPIKIPSPRTSARSGTTTRKMSPASGVSLQQLRLGVMGPIVNVAVDTDPPPGCDGVERDGSPARYHAIANDVDSDADADGFILPQSASSTRAEQCRLDGHSVLHNEPDQPHHSRRTSTSQARLGSYQPPVLMSIDNVAQNPMSLPLYLPEDLDTRVVDYRVGSLPQLSNSPRMSSSL